MNHKIFIHLFILVMGQYWFFRYRHDIESIFVTKIYGDIDIVDMLYCSCLWPCHIYLNFIPAKRERLSEGN